jgi:hypothetical protein
MPLQSGQVNEKNGKIAQTQQLFNTGNLLKTLQMRDIQKKKNISIYFV